MSFRTRYSPAKIALVATLTIGASVAARAADPAAPQPASALVAAGGTIAYGGEVLMRLRTDAGGYDSARRADEVITRLRPILELSRLRAGDVAVKRDPSGAAMITVRDLPLVLVDRDLARANNTDAMGLARVWAGRLQSVLPQVATNQ